MWPPLVPRDCFSTTEIAQRMKDEQGERDVIDVTVAIE